MRDLFVLITYAPAVPNFGGFNSLHLAYLGKRFAWNFFIECVK